MANNQKNAAALNNEQTALPLTSAQKYGENAIDGWAGWVPTVHVKDGDALVYVTKGSGAVRQGKVGAVLQREKARTAVWFVPAPMEQTQRINAAVMGNLLDEQNREMAALKQQNLDIMAMLSKLTQPSA